jgi:hypothetical protein
MALVIELRQREFPEVLMCKGFMITMVLAMYCLAPALSQAQQPKTTDVGGAGTTASESPDSTAPAVYTPMTQGERTKYYLAHTFSAESVLRSAAGSGILQGLNTPSEWGQGAEGYGLRFANSWGQHFIRSTLMFGASSVLHEDNRYFQSGKSGFWPRFKYAVASAFLAERDDGTRRLSVSRIGSYTATAFISREWQPPSTRGPENAANALGVALGVEIGFNVAREFFPKILRSRNPAVRRTIGPDEASPQARRMAR